ncbi:MAG: GspH/FimT family pseudopilin [Acidobacteriota bacterium]|nr:GspH/FimT family pseudopilin [Acidobacteriota bacterium]
MNPQKSRQAGFSLVELLTVVAIIGVLALVSVPNFVSFYQSNKVKSAMRNFTSDLRTMRQMAITTGVQTRITFSPDSVVTPASRAYDFWQGDSAFGATPAWTQLTQPNITKKALTKGYTRHLEDVVYFPTAGQTFDATNGVYSVVFFPDGRVGMPAGVTTASVVLKTDMKLPKQQYVIDISPSGRVYAH